MAFFGPILCSCIALSCHLMDVEPYSLVVNTFMALKKIKKKNKNNINKNSIPFSNLDNQIRSLQKMERVLSSHLISNLKVGRCYVDPKKIKLQT